MVSEVTDVWPYPQASSLWGSVRKCSSQVLSMVSYCLSNPSHLWQRYSHPLPQSPLLSSEAIYKSQPVFSLVPDNDTDTHFSRFLVRPQITASVPSGSLPKMWAYHFPWLVQLYSLIISFRQEMILFFHVDNVIIISHKYFPLYTFRCSWNKILRPETVL